MPPLRLTRRQLLKGTAVSTIGAVAFTGCASGREFLLQSPVDVPPDLAEGRDNWYASVCGLCEAGCGIIVRVMEGRVKKIEGNPDYPVNQGKLCPLGQAGPQVLYHPDRLRGPMKRSGDRGSGRFEPITWDRALDELATHVGEAQAAGTAGLLALIAPAQRGSRALVVDRFVRGIGARLLVQGAPDAWAIRAAGERLFGSPVLPELDLGAARYVLSFGADLLGSWLSPVRYARGYGQLRGRREGRGTLVQVEPRLSATAASADTWVPIRPGSEGVLALSLAQVIVAEGLAVAGSLGALGAAGPAALERYRPDRAAEETGLEARRIADLARAFARSGPSLAIGGGAAAAHTNGYYNLSAIQLLNQLVGGVGAAGGVRPNPAPPAALPVPVGPASLADWQKLVDDLGRGGGHAVLVLAGGANPAYGLPATLKLRDALQKAALLVSFSSLMDESAALADLILPEHTYLEDWGLDVPEPGPGFPVVGLQQPVVRPLQDTRSFVDVLLALAEKLGGDTRRSLQWRTHQEVIRESLQAVQRQGAGSVPGRGFEAFWLGALQRGGWWDNRSAPPSPAPTARAVSLEPQAPRYAGDPREYPFHLYPFATSALSGGRGAHLPWLQAVPEPMTTVAWGSWIEINPTTARRLGVNEGDVVRVESPDGALDVPVYVFPGIAPDVVAIPLGQGHSASGRYARSRGVNALDLLAPLADAETGALAWAATRVRLRKAGKRVELAKFEGVPLPPFTEPEESTPVKVTHEG